MQKFIISIFLAIVSIHSIAQKSKIDSLVDAINAQRIDSNIYTSCIEVAKLYSDSAYDKSLFYFEKALDIAEKSSNRKKVADVYVCIGNVYYTRGEFPIALENYNNALEIYNHLKKKICIGVVFNNIGLIYKNWGKYDKALENFYSAIKLYDEIGDAENGALTFNNIGQIYYYQNEYEKAIDYFKKYLEFNTITHNQRAAASADNNIASAYMELGSLDNAEYYFNQSMKIYDSLGIKSEVAVIMDNIGILFFKKEKYTKALLYHSEAFKIFEKIGSQSRICPTLHNMGLAYYKLNQPDLAIKFLNQSLEIANRLKQKDAQKDLYNSLSEVYMQTKQFENALKSYKLFVQIKDSLINSETTRKIETIQAAYDDQKKEKEIAAINQKLHIQKVLEVIFAGVFILFIFLTALIIRENQRKKKIINNSEKRTKNLNNIIGKTNQLLLLLQKNNASIKPNFNKVWQVSLSKENSFTHHFHKDNCLFIAFLSKRNPFDTNEIATLSIYYFLHTIKNISNSLTIKEQYQNFLAREGIWQDDIDSLKGLNIDFWCLRKGHNQLLYSGSLCAFRVNGKNQITNLDGNSCEWLNFVAGDRFYFYTTNNFDDFKPHEQELFQNVFRKTIIKTIDFPFEEQKEVFSNCLELIDAGSDTHFDITIFAFMV